MEAARYYQLRI